MHDGRGIVIAQLVVKVLQTLYNSYKLLVPSLLEEKQYAHLSGAHRPSIFPQLHGRRTPSKGLGRKGSLHLG
jgi:hypothetical protein